MPKFRVTKKVVTIQTEVRHIEATDEQDAKEKVICGDGKLMERFPCDGRTEVTKIEKLDESTAV